MNSQQSIVLSVPKHVARNPVARSIERKRMHQWAVQVSLEMMALEDGTRCDSILVGVAEAVAIALKTIEGWDDPQGIGLDLIKAMAALQSMAEGGYLWRVADCEQMCAAADYSVQILSGMEPAEKMKAWAWAQKINRRAQAEAAHV
jgi:hypothetical protein